MWWFFLLAAPENSQQQDTHQWEDLRASLFALLAVPS